jgi:sortase A
VWSWLLLAGGLLLLVSGSREFLSSWWAQEDFAEEWAKEVPEPAPGKVEPPSPPSRQTRFERGAFIARMTIPRLKTELYVVEGVGKKELRRGPGHLPGTGLPGDSDNTIIAGHRDTHFRVLKDIQPGDEIILEHQGEHLVYRVDGTKIVRPTETSILSPSDSARLTLVTCYPFYYLGPAPKRFIVQADLARRVSLESAKRIDKPDSAGM